MFIDRCLVDLSGSGLNYVLCDQYKKLYYRIDTEREAEGGIGGNDQATFLLVNKCLFWQLHAKGITVPFSRTKGQQ